MSVVSIADLVERAQHKGQWHLQAPDQFVGINAVGAWSHTPGDPKIKIVVLDTGVDVEHPDLEQNIDADAAVDFDQSFEGRRGKGARIHNEYDAHGTALAGIVAASGQRGCVGVAPRCKILPVRISTNFEFDSLINAVDYARKHGHVLLLARSLPYIDPYQDGPHDPKELDKSEELRRTLEETAGEIPVICASGNNGTASLAYPASLDGMIAVGACNERGFRSTYSQHGEGLDLVAPSNDVPVENRQIVRLTKVEADRRAQRREEAAAQWSLAESQQAFAPVDLGAQKLGTRFIATTDNLGPSGYNVEPAGDYCEAEGNYGFGGTSAAAAQVAGVVALMLSANPKLTPGDIKQILRHKAKLKGCLKPELAPIEEKDHRDWCAEFGFGLVDAKEAVAEAMERTAARS